MRRSGILLLLLLLCTGLRAQEIVAPFKDLADTITQVTGMPPTAGNSITTFNDGRAFLRSLLDDIDGARESIDLEFYWFDKDTVGRAVREALIKKAQEGVRVRVLVDNLVTPLMPTAFYNKMRKAGIQFYVYHDYQNLRIWQIPSSILGTRDHRKIAVIDHRIFHTGGMNLCQVILSWKDHNIRLEGPVAASMSNIFEQHWRRESGGAPAPFVPIPEGSGGLLCQAVDGDGSPLLEQLYISAIRRSQRYIWLQTPYLVLPEPILEALLEQSRKGVDVRIFLPEKSDWPFMNEITREYYPAMMKAGIKLYTCDLYYDHGKGFVADDYLVCCGTMNLDKRSFRLNRENCILFYGEAMAAMMRSKYLKILETSRPVDLDKDQPSSLRKVWRNFLHSIDPLL